MRFADCYTPITLEAARGLKAAGYAGVIRYLGGMSCGFSKGLTKNEVLILKSEGLKIVSVFERGPQSMTGGNTAGVQDARDALEDAQTLGQPKGSTIFFAADFDAQPTQYPLLREYMQGVESVLKGAYQTGIYAGFGPLMSITADHYWQSASWSYGHISSNAVIRQVQENVEIGGNLYDINEVFSDPGWWPIDPKHYEKYNVLVTNGSKTGIYSAVAEGGKTYILWTALQTLGYTYQYKDEGLMIVNGKNVQGILVDDEDSYLPWDELGLEAKKVEWSFTVKS